MKIIGFRTIISLGIFFIVLFSISTVVAENVTISAVQPDYDEISVDIETFSDYQDKNVIEKTKDVNICSKKKDVVLKKDFKKVLSTEKKYVSNNTDKAPVKESVSKLNISVKSSDTNLSKFNSSKASLNNTVDVAVKLNKFLVFSQNYEKNFDNSIYNENITIQTYTTGNFTFDNENRKHLRLFSINHNSDKIINLNFNEDNSSNEIENSIIKDIDHDYVLEDIELYGGTVNETCLSFYASGTEFDDNIKESIFLNEDFL